MKDSCCNDIVLLLRALYQQIYISLGKMSLGSYMNQRMQEQSLSPLFQELQKKERHLFTLISIFLLVSVKSVLNIISIMFELLIL